MSDPRQIGIRVPKHIEDELAAALGVDHNTGKWTPEQYVIDAGWDAVCIEATAKHGIATCDAGELTTEQNCALFAYCQVRYANAVLAMEEERDQYLAEEESNCL